MWAVDNKPIELVTGDPAVYEPGAWESNVRCKNKPNKMEMM